MKKARFLFVILALILVVGMTTGLIVRKQTGGQTVMQHSAQGPAETTPATDDSIQDSVDPFEKILLLVNHDDEHPVVVMDNGVVIDPIDTYWVNGEPSAQSGAKPASGTNHVPFDRYLVTPGASSITIQSSLNDQKKDGDSPEKSDGFDIYLLQVETGNMNGDVHITYDGFIHSGVPYNIAEDTFCVLVNFDEYTFVTN